MIKDKLEVVTNDKVEVISKDLLKFGRCGYWGYGQNSRILTQIGTHFSTSTTLDQHFLSQSDPTSAYIVNNAHTETLITSENSDAVRFRFRVLQKIVFSSKSLYL